MPPTIFRPVGNGDGYGDGYGYGDGDGYSSVSNSDKIRSA